MNNTLTWNLSNPAAQTPEYWLLFVDGEAWEALVTPYTGPGKYSADLDALFIPLTPGQHTFSVALVGGNSMGPQSPAVTLDYAPPASAAPVVPGAPAAPAPPSTFVWPTADTVVAVAALATSTISEGPTL